MRLSFGVLGKILRECKNPSVSDVLLVGTLTRTIDSTARLGETTTIMTTRRGDADWICVKIDFERLNENKNFLAPVARKAKNSPDESGTKIVISRLKTGILAELPSKENEIRQRLESVYAPLLATEPFPSRPRR